MQQLLDYLNECVQKHPQKIAVSLKGEAYSFSRLEQKARQYGYLIAQHGLKNAPVGVIAEHSVETIAMFFGVLYSGNFYVPIDPEMPAQKKKMIIDDAELSIILGNEVHFTELSSIAFAGAYITEKQLTASLANLPDTSPDDPAYMIYTSGSTGKPKGVLKSHKAVITYIESFAATFDITADDIIGNQTPFFFDASAKDIYLMLKRGCTMEIIPQTLFVMPPELIDYLNEKRITYICWVPTALTIVAQLNPFSIVKPTTLKKVFFVGEVMQIKHLKKWMEALPEVQYVNLYGSSEIAGICTYYPVPAGELKMLSLPMGKPMSHCKIYLLDNESIVTAPNHIGEMYLVSDSLATEYYHDAEKTRSSFLDKDFGDGPVRCFKTGDLAQYDADGNLVFASRTDFQIKHMGRRIELGEIEAICTETDEISRCACIYNQEKRKIILVCTLSEGVNLKPLELKSILKKHLTTYMVPNKIIILEKLPLNANGKIDRQQLIKDYT